MNLTFFAKKYSEGLLTNAIAIASDNSNLIDCNIFIDLKFINLDLQDFKLGNRNGMLKFKLKIQNKPDLEYELFYLGNPPANKDYIINSKYSKIDNSLNITLCWSEKAKHFFEILIVNNKENNFMRIIPTNSPLWN